MATMDLVVGRKAGPAAPNLCRCAESSRASDRRGVRGVGADHSPRSVHCEYRAVSRMNLTTDPPHASVQTEQANRATDSGTPPVLGRIRIAGGSVLTARRWSAVMALLVGISVALFLICLQFGTQWIGFGQILDI